MAHSCCPIASFNPSASSITAACANGGIRKIHHVDWEANSILGVVSTYRCVVWGE